MIESGAHANSMMVRVWGIIGFEGLMGGSKVETAADDEAGFDTYVPARFCAIYIAAFLAFSACLLLRSISRCMCGAYAILAGGLTTSGSVAPPLSGGALGPVVHASAGPTLASGC